MLPPQGNSLEEDVSAVVLGEAIRQIALRHVHTARIKIANIQDEQRATVEILCDVVDVGPAVEAMHGVKADA